MNDTVKKAFGDNQDINNALNNEYFKEAIYAGAIQWGGKNGAKKLVIPREVTNQYSFRDVPDLDKDGNEQMVIPAGGGKPVVKTKKEKYVSGKDIVYWRGRDNEKKVIVAKMKADRKAADDRTRARIAKTTSPTAKPQSAPAQANESQLRYAIQEALKRKLSPLKEAEEKSSALLYQVVLVLSVSKPIRDIAGKLNRIRAIEGVTIVSHEREEDTIYRGDVVAKVKFHPTSDIMTPTTYINQYLVPQINSSKLVPEVKVLKVAQGTLKEI